MAVPFPSAEEALQVPPSFDEAERIMRAFVTASAPADGPTRLQQLVAKALVSALTGHDVEVDGIEPVTPDVHAEGMARRTKEFRLRTVEIMILLELLLQPLPPEVAERVEQFADALGVGDDCRDLVNATKHVAEGALAVAGTDFERNGYECRYFEQHPEVVKVEPSDAWAAVEDDPAMAARWAALEHQPAGSLGRLVWEFYRARGFVFPGLPGSAPPLLAWHDWLHVLGDYGTTVESELEVFGLIYRANDDPRAFSLLVSVLGLFEAGYLERGMGLFERDAGHISADERMATRLGAAMARGAYAAWDFNLAHPDEDTHGIDFLGIDWFSYAHLPLAEAQRVLCMRPKTADALAVGSVGPWEPGGISPYQWECGRLLAEAEERPYESYGASPAPVSAPAPEPT